MALVVDIIMEKTSCDSNWHSGEKSEGKGSQFEAVCIVIITILGYFWCENENPDLII